MKRLILLILLLLPLGSLIPLVDGFMSDSATAASLTPQQQAAKKKADAKKRADAKKKAANKRKAAAIRKKAAARKKASAKKRAAAAKKKAAAMKAAAKKKATAKTTTGRSSVKTQPTPHYVAAWGELGYSALFSNLDQHHTRGGVGAGIGVGYELDYNKFLFQAGVGFTYLSSVTALSDRSEDISYTYLPASSAITYTHDYSHLRYTDQVGLVRIPLRFGYRFTDNWYAMLGVTAGIGVFASSRYQYSDYVYARDEQFAENFHNIGHGTGTTDYSNKTSYSSGITLAPGVEAGYQFTDNVRLGVFADYGICLGQEAGPAQINSGLFVGARVTARFNMPRKVKPAPVQPQIIPEIEPVPEPEPEIVPEPEPEPGPKVPVFYGEQEVVTNQVVVLENLLFVFDRADIIPESTAALDTLLAMLLSNKDISILIIGHTDIMGSAAYNLRLSKQRAKAVRDYLVEHGVEPYRLSYDGRGANEPVDTNDTEAGRQHNRRVEFVIL